MSERQQMGDGRQLLADYAANGSEAAFQELVTRYLNLVYSAALRLVHREPHLAEDVAQTVFADLARLARSLPREVMLGGWLHRHTCFVASKMLRTERRRQARERQAVEMNNSEDHSAANLASVAPILDDAINQLDAEDRAAVLLRFFEQHDFQTVGTALGVNEDAARKRVDRALDKLELLLKRRGVAFSAAALATALATQAVAAAPAGLAVTISTVAFAGAAAGTGTTLTLLNIMSMTKLKIGVATVIIAAGVTVPLVMHHQAKTELRATQEALGKKEAEIARIASESEQLAKRVASAPVTTATVSNGPSREVLRLRSEVGRLRQENLAIATARTNGPSALSGLTANPEMFKLIRDQQKAGLGALYKDFATQTKLTPEASGKLADLLADHIMGNIERVTELLRDGKSPEEMKTSFAAQDVVLSEQLQSLIGPEALGQFQDYTHKLASRLTADQFKPKLSGDSAAKETKTRQLYQAMLEETQAALASAGLPADFQTVPNLNFINIASESEAEKNLKLLDDIYGRVLARTPGFLSEEEIRQFGEFRSLAINNNRAVLLINRKMMMPGGK